MPQEHDFRPLLTDSAPEENPVHLLISSQGPGKAFWEMGAFLLSLAVTGTLALNPDNDPFQLLTALILPLIHLVAAVPVLRLRTLLRKSGRSVDLLMIPLEDSFYAKPLRNQYWRATALSLSAPLVFLTCSSLKVFIEKDPNLWDCLVPNLCALDLVLKCRVLYWVGLRSIPMAFLLLLATSVADAIVFAVFASYFGILGLLPPLLFLWWMGHTLSLSAGEHFRKALEDS